MVNDIGGFRAEELETLIRLRGHDILFVGRPYAYMQGAKILIDAFRIIKGMMPDLKLHIIGMTDADFSDLPKDVICYGYLHKDIESERNQYYHLMRSCAVFCNPSANWGGYSSTIEAMFYGMPIVVTPYEDFVANFGEELDCGEYLKKQNCTTLSTIIMNVLNSDKYDILCRKAHLAVADYTWDRYVDEFLDTIKKIEHHS